LNIAVTAIPADRFYEEPLAIPVFLDVMPPRGDAGNLDFRLGGKITRWILDGNIDPDSPELTLFSTGEGSALPQLFIYSAGTWSGMNDRMMEDAVAGMAGAILKAGPPRFGIAARDFKRPNVPAREAAQILLSGLARGAKAAGVTAGRSVRLYWSADQAELLAREMRRVRHKVRAARDWVIHRASEDSEWLGQD